MTPSKMSTQNTPTLTHTVEAERCPALRRGRDRKGAEREGNWRIVSQHSAFASCSVTPPGTHPLPPHLPTPWQSSERVNGPRRAAGPSRWIPNRWGSVGSGAVTKTQRKKGKGGGGGGRWQHAARSKKRYRFVKNKHVWYLSGALQQNGGKRNVSFFYYYSNL